MKKDVVEEKELNYERYEELVVQRDQLRKDASSVEISYTKEFGDLITGIFKTKIESIRLKKMIAKITQVVNRGETVDFSSIKKEVESELTAYNEQLKGMLVNLTMAKESKDVPDYIYDQVKRIYRRLAKMIHPDIYPEFDFDPRAQELWIEVEKAYRYYNLELLQDLEAAVIQHIDADEDKKPKLTFSELEERIERLEREIDRIIHTKPYTYRELLEDRDAVAENKEKLSVELEEYKAYVKDLSNKLDSLIDGMEVGVIWQMN